MQLHGGFQFEPLELSASDESGRWITDPNQPRGGGGSGGGSGGGVSSVWQALRQYVPQVSSSSASASATASAATPIPAHARHHHRFESSTNDSHRKANNVSPLPLIQPLDSQPPQQVWVIRDVPYTCTLTTPPHNGAVPVATTAKPYDLKQKLTLYIPLQLWPPHERMSVFEQIRAWLVPFREFRAAAEHPSPASPASSVASAPALAAVAAYRGLQSHTRLPVLVDCHGGSWMMGDPNAKNVQERMLAMCRRIKCIGVSVGYRLCRMQSIWIDIGLLMWILAAIALSRPESGYSSTYRMLWLAIAWFCLVFLAYSLYLRWNTPVWMHPTQVEDVADAIKWVYTHAPCWGGDPSRLVLMGHSAGAHLITALYASPRFWERTTVPRECIRAILPFSGPYSADSMRSRALRPLGRLVFGTDEQSWDEAFVCELIDRYKHQVPRWPAVLMWSAEFDWGLCLDARELYARLRHLHCPQLQWYTVENTTHFSILAHLDWQHHRIADISAAFLERYAGFELQSSHRSVPPPLADEFHPSFSISNDVGRADGSLLPMYGENK